MRYLRNTARDAYYGTTAVIPGRKIREKNFAKSPEDHCKATLVTSITKDIPQMAKATCYWCRSQRKYDDFVKVKHTNNFTIEWAPTKFRNKVVFTSNICVYCLCYLFDAWKARYRLPDIEVLYMICSFSNIYFDKQLAQSILDDEEPRFYDDILLSDDVHYVDRYMRKIEDGYQGPTTFWDQDCSPFRIIQEVEARLKNAESNKQSDGNLDEGTTKHLRDEDIDNYNTIWGMYHYDPFEGDDPRDQRRLRADLVTMIDDAMNGDIVRMKAALEVVRAYHRIEKIGETLSQLQATPDDTVQNSNAIKQLTAAKAQETTMVTQFSKDHGFAAKYAMAKSKGSGTLSAVIRDMKDAHYDLGVVNKYDIETSEAIKQVSDISAESIFKQIGFTAAEYADMVKEQAEEIRRLTDELRSKEEELRLFKEKEVKQDLLEELKSQLESKGIPTENVEQMIRKEYLKNKETIPL